MVTTSVIELKAKVPRIVLRGGVGQIVRGLGFFFFFSSRRRHTRLTCDWSSDVVLFRSFAAMQGLGLTPPECPSPLNLFMNIPWTPTGSLSFDPPTTKPGDYVTLKAELDCIVAMSACQIGRASCRERVESSEVEGRAKER